MITLSGALVLSLVLILLFILSWAVFKISSYISIFILKKINYQVKINKKQLSLLSAIASIGILSTLFIGLEVVEFETLYTQAIIAIYLLNMFIIFLLITAFFKFKKISISHFNLLYLFSSIVSLILWTILFYFLMSCIYFFKEYLPFGNSIESIGLLGFILMLVFFALLVLAIAS